MFRGGLTVGGTVVLGIVGILALILTVSGIMWATADLRGATDANEQIKADGDFRIAAYDEFYSLCSAAQTHQQALENAEERVKGTNDADQLENNQTDVFALQNQLNSTVNEYNAKAASDYTVGQFRDSDLPYQINAEEDIVCSA